MNKKILASVAAILAFATATGTGQAFINDPKYNSSVITAAAAEQMPDVEYYAHVQSKGWMSPVKNGATAGTENNSLRLEGLVINLPGVRYRAHVQSKGWEDHWSKSGEKAGTEGEKKAIEAIKIGLTGAMGSKYDIYYRVHVEGYGWLGWAKNEESAGTTNGKKRMEAIQICLVNKGAKPKGYNASKPAYHKFVPTDVFKSQPQGSVTCTLISSLMMLRGRKFLDDNKNNDTNSNTSYRNISESQLVSAGAWGSSGLAGSFYCAGYHVVCTAKMNGISEQNLKNMLDIHPEGIVLFIQGNGQSHAVYLTDYANGLCCADPAPGYANKRILLKDSLLGQRYGSNSGILSQTVQLWYINN